MNGVMHMSTGKLTEAKARVDKQRQQVEAAEETEDFRAELNSLLAN